MKELTKNFLLENNYVQKKTSAVYDPEFTKALRALPWSEWMEAENPMSCREEYIETYYNWILSSKLNSIRGLESFPIRHLTNGTTQSFDEFYYKNKERRLRFFKAEYAYHMRVVQNWLHLEKEPVQENDFIIISAPFCSTGEVHEQTTRVLDEAHKLSVPVLIDCAYFGTVIDFSMDFNHPAIESVCFSLTKGTGLGDIRSGIRFSREENELPISQQNRFNHTVLGAAKIGLYMMNRFGPDYIPVKYRPLQLEVCERAGFVPQKCIHLAHGNEEWDDFKIDLLFNRLGIKELIKAKRKGLI